MPNPSISRAAWRPEFFGTCILDLNADLVAGADGTAIGTWANQAPTGAANNFTQATGSKQPVVKRNIIGGRSTLLFDGANTFLTGTLVTTGAISRYVVFKFVGTPAASTSWELLCLKDSTAAFNETFVLNAGGYQPYSFLDKSPTSAVASVGIADALNTSPHVLGVVYNNGAISTPASYTVSLDGVSKTVVASGAIGTPNTASTAIGARVVAGVGSSFVSGHIARVLVFSTNLSAAADAAVVTYLRGIYGI